MEGNYFAVRIAPNTIRHMLGWVIDECVQRKERRRVCHQGPRTGHRLAYEPDQILSGPPDLPEDSPFLLCLYRICQEHSPGQRESEIHCDRDYFGKRLRPSIRRKHHLPNCHGLGSRILTRSPPSSLAPTEGIRPRISAKYSSSVLMGITHAVF